MLLENFYKVIEIKTVDNTTTALISINKEHIVFKGHFPDNPVMPGVCMIQIIKEITEEVTGTTLFMEKCSNVKFMALINPEVNSILKLELMLTDDNETVKVKNATYFEDTLALKLIALYRKL